MGIGEIARRLLGSRRARVRTIGFASLFFTSIILGQNCTGGFGAAQKAIQGASSAIGGTNGGTNADGSGSPAPIGSAPTDPIKKDPDNVAPVVSVKATCTSPELRGTGKRGIRRLTVEEIKATLSDIGWPEAWRLNDMLAGYPEVDEMNDVGAFDQLYSEGQAFEWLRAMDDSIQMISGSGGARRSLGGDCFTASTITETCWKDFFKNLGRKLYRRPLETAEISFLTDAVKTRPTGDAIYMALQMLLRSPDFLFHLESGASTDGTRVRLTDHEVANRLSYALTGSLPDPALAAAADAGQVKTLDQVETHARRLVETAKAKTKLMNFFREWLVFSSVSEPNDAYLDWILGLGRSPGVDKAYRQEMEDYISYVVWTDKGTFRDLMTKQIAFPRSYGIYYGAGPNQGKNWSPISGIYTGDAFTNFAVHGKEEPRPFAAPNHPGLIFRAGLLANGQFATNPIRRGVYIKRRVFCDPLPSPDFSVINSRLDEVGELDPHQIPNHEIVTRKTSAPACVGCHSQINPIGFSLEMFDSAGKLRTMENVYHSNLYLAPTSHPLPGAIPNVTLGGKTMTISSPAQFADEIAKSPKAQACMATFALRHFDRRYENPADGCGLADAVKPLEEGKPILEFFVKSIANEDIFWRKQ